MFSLANMTVISGLSQRVAAGMLIEQLHSKRIDNTKYCKACKTLTVYMCVCS